MFSGHKKITTDSTPQRYTYLATSLLPIFIFWITEMIYRDDESHYLVLLKILSPLPIKSNMIICKSHSFL